MQAAENNHQQQIEALYFEHHGWLQSWLRRRLDNSFDAADLTHDTFVRVLNRRLPDALNEPRAYLTTIAKGVLVNWYHRRTLEQAYLDALAMVPEEQAPSPEQNIIILETLHEVDAMLDALPVLVKRAFLLSQIEGLKYDDIARRLGISLITVKRYMTRAFRQCLEIPT